MSNHNEDSVSGKPSNDLSLSNLAFGRMSSCKGLIRSREAEVCSLAALEVGADDIVTNTLTVREQLFLEGSQLAVAGYGVFQDSTALTSLGDLPTGIVPMGGTGGANPPSAPIPLSWVAGPTMDTAIAPDTQSLQVLAGGVWRVTIDTFMVDNEVNGGRVNVYVGVNATVPTAADVLGSTDISGNNTRPFSNSFNTILTLNAGDSVRVYLEQAENDSGDWQNQNTRVVLERLA